MMKKCFSRFLSSQVLRGGKNGEIFTAGKKIKPTKAKTQHCSYLENSSAVGKKRNTKVWTLFLKCLHTEVGYRTGVRSSDPPARTEKLKIPCRDTAIHYHTEHICTAICLRFHILSRNHFPHASTNFLLFASGKR